MSKEKYIEECKCCEVDMEIKKELCPVCLTQRLIRGKWKIVIIWLLKDHELRFSQLRRSISNISQAYLSTQLKELESDGLVIRKSYNEMPPRVEYFLTRQGKNFVEVIRQMYKWGTDYIGM